MIPGVQGVRGRADVRLVQRLPCTGHSSLPLSVPLDDTAEKALAYPAHTSGGDRELAEG